MNGRICAIYHKQLGDVVLLQPALDRLTAGGHIVELLTHPQLRPLIELMGPDVIPYRVALHRRKALYAFDPSSKTTIGAAFTRACVKHLVTFDNQPVSLKHRMAYDNVIQAPGGDAYRAEFFWSQLPAPNTSVFTPPRLLPPPDDWLPPALKNKSYLLIHPTAAWKRKCLGPDVWSSFLERLQLPKDWMVVITSGSNPWEQELARQIRSSKYTVRNLGGTTTLRQYLAVVSKARAVAAIDGSASHLAQAFKVPALTVFGHAKPCHWHWNDADHLACIIPRGDSTPEGWISMPSMAVIGQMACFFERRGDT